MDKPKGRQKGRKGRGRFRLLEGSSYRFILLVEIVDISIQDLNEQFNGHSRVHTGIGHSECSL